MNNIECFKENITSIYGADGQRWLDKLPAIVSEIAKKYHLTALTPVNNMSFNYVVSGYQDSCPIILKLGLNSKALMKEAHCLRVFANHGAVEVLADTDNMIIMKRAVPGTTLKKYFASQEVAATQILCHVIKKLNSVQVPRDHNFYNVKDLLKTLDNHLNIPDSILSKARALRDSLLSSTDKEVLLHGDLHHNNILNNGDDWLVIDPKGFIGDPAFEPIAYLCNPIPELLQEDNAKKIVSIRIKLCAEKLGLSEQRMNDWLYVKLVLCWAWSLEDNLDPGYWSKFLEKMQTNQI